MSHHSMVTVMRFCFLLLLVAAFGLRASGQNADVAQFMAKVRSGGPVTIVAIGGSITMESGGWADQTAARLADQFPQSDIRFINAGISSTGSNLGVFRLHRDVLMYQPDLVFIEFAVNDFSVTDGVCIRNLESIVVRLKQMPKPPAIVFVQAASREGAKHHRHQAVASHYSLLAIDLQAMVNRHAAIIDDGWEALFKDNVHPNAAGHQAYAQTVVEQLLAMDPPEPDSAWRQSSLPIPLSDALILNGSLIVPQFQSAGWRYMHEEQVGWWSRFFQGSLRSSDDGEALHVAFYGRTVGVWLLLKHGKGRIRLYVDGKHIHDMSAESPSWYYRLHVAPQLWEEDWHVLSIAPVVGGEGVAEARVGYLLAADPTTAPISHSIEFDQRWRNSIEMVEAEMGQ